MPKLLLTDKAIQIMGAISAAASVIMLGLLAIMWGHVLTLGQSLDAFGVTLNEANKRLSDAGEPTVAAPPAPAAPPAVGPAPRLVTDQYCQSNGRWRLIYTDGTSNENGGQCRGPAGAAPTRDQMLIAVQAFCRDNNACRGPSGKPGTNGKDGQNVTPAQVAAAFATYCDANGRCRGEDGREGPGPTDDQIIGAVALFCADGACRGQDGKEGKQGEPGRGIAENGTNCIDGRWQVTYTDGETEDAGACTPAPAPTQTVTEPGPTTTVTITPTPTPTGEATQ